MYRIIGADGRDYGPVGADELRQWISEGRANAQSQVRLEGATDWRPLGTFPEFAASFATAIPAVPATLPTVYSGSGSSAKTNSMAVAGFVLSLLSLCFFCCCCFGLPSSILGLIFSCIGLSQINKNPMQGGKGLAIAGIIISILSLLLSGGFSILGMLGSMQDQSFFD